MTTGIPGIVPKHKWANRSYSKSFIPFLKCFILVCFFIFTANKSFSQTSWKGTVNTNWNYAGNWTAGIPTSTINAIIGDANFTGSNQPTVNASSSCNSITIGGAVATTITLSKNLVVSGNFTINGNGTVIQQKSALTIKGNWINNGTYTTSNNSLVIFGGVSQTISGSSLTTFRGITINAGALVTLGTSIAAGGSKSAVKISGTLDPGQSPTYMVTSSSSFTVNNNGQINVNASTFAANYNLSGSVTLSSGSIVQYSSTIVNQTVSSAYSYSTLIISGTGTKTLTANLPSLVSSNAKMGNIFVNSGTLDLGAFTANRSTSITGGSFNVANGAYLKVGGASNFPVNYNTVSLALGSNVEYDGTAQTVSAQTYGDLIFSSGSGGSVKTMPGTDFTIQGNFSSIIGSGTSVSYTAASNITMNGNVSIGVSTTFNGGSYSHTVGGNWVNNGTFAGSTSSITFNGPSTGISGSGTENFNNISFTASGITAASGTTLNVSGNLSTSGSGQFTHASGGLITMTGATKTISGTNIILNDLTVSGSATTNTSFIINSNLSVSGSFSASAGTVLMSGTSKTISGTGTIAFSTLQITGTITTASSFSILTLLNVVGTLSASAGTATFKGTSVLSGTANLYNVTLNGTSLQLSATSVLGIANTMTVTTGTLNVTSTLPNTVNFNGTGAQSINAITYNNLILSNGNTKIAAGNVTVNGTITISSFTTFAGGSYTHTILANWVNNGTFTPSTSTVQFTGNNNSTIGGVTTFNILTINKSAATSTVTLLNNISVPILNMTNGKMLTGSNSITITSTRTGNGIIIGTITHTHAFSTGISYAFEGPYNTITFAAATGVTSITVTVILGAVADFPNNASINREYDISITATSFNATLRLHYEDAGLNGNNEALMGMWDHPSSWTSVGKTANDVTNNYVEQSGLTNISSRWTCSEIPGVVSWNGSVSTDWNTAANWTNVSGTASTPPGATDIVQIGTAAFSNQPTISTAVSIKGISFGSAQASTLTIGSGGSLTTSGNIGGNWTADAVHTINAGSQNITVNGDLNLSNGVNNRSINLNIGSGSVSVHGSVIQNGNASVIFTGNGSLNVGNDFVYTSGTFTAGTGTVTYNGTEQQAVAGVAYNNLVVNNTPGNATIPAGLAVTIGGNLSILSGQLKIDTTSITVNGDITINSGAVLNCYGVAINAAGNWTNNGSYFSTTGTVTFNGTGAQNISAGNFNNLALNNSSGIVNLTGNNIIAGNLALSSGTLNVATYTLNSQSSGGTFSMAAGTTLQVGGANNFPSSYSSTSLNTSSTVLYNGNMAQSVAGVTYGNLALTNGGSNAKTQLSDLSVAGNLTINSGATFNSGGYTTNLWGNWNNGGTFTASTGALILNGTSKILSGNNAFNNVIVNGSYTVAGSTITFNGALWVTTGASYISSATTTFNGNLTNNGTLVGNGNTTFTGISVQTIRLVNALLSSSTGVVNFNGNVSPILNSNSSPQFATLNINNTAGLDASTGSTIYVALNIGSGAIMNAGNGTHNIYGSFTNAGTVSSTGTINFIPVTAKTLALGSSGFSSDGIVNFGGTGPITITGTPDSLNTVIISNTNSAGISPSSNWIVDSNFVITQNAIFNAGTYTYTVGGDIVSDGTLNGNSSTFIITSDSAELSASTETIFNHFTNSGSLQPQTDFYVAGNFMNNGTYDGSLGTLIMTGNSASTIGGTTTPSAIEQLTIQKSGNATVTQNVDMSMLQFLNIFSGILFTSTHGITQDPSGGVLVVNDSATLRIGGTNSLPGFSGYNLSLQSNVDYAGASTTQAIGNAAIYGNLIISGAGNKNAYTPLTVAGNLTMSAGNLNTNTMTVTHSIAGDFIMNGGTISGTAATYILNGTNEQALTLLSNLFKLKVNKSSGKVNLGANVTVTNTLNFTMGNIKTGNYTVIIPSGGTVAGASQGTGWVYGNLQKNIVTGSSVSRSFEIGDSSYYTPSTILFASVSTAGNFTEKVTPTDQPQADLSGLDTSKSVNRYWSLTNSGVVFTTATATFNWVASDVDPSANTANFKTAVYNGTNYLLTSVANPLATSIQATGCTGFGDFEVGEAISQYKWTGGAMTSDWNNNANWSGGIVPTSSLNTLIPSGISGGRVYPLLNSGTSIVKDLTIDSSASLTVSGGNLQITGAITNSGTLDASNGTIEMHGTSPQIIPAGAFKNNNVKNLIISNTSSGGVTLAGNVDVYQSLTYGVSGAKLNTGGYLTLKSNASETAWVGDMTGQTITGDVTVERYVAAINNWQFLAVPTQTMQTIHQAWQENQDSGVVGTVGYGTNITGPAGGIGFDFTSPNPSMKYWDWAANSYKTITNTSIQFPNIKNGFFIYIRGDRRATASGTTPHQSTVLRTKGPLNIGTVNFTIPANTYYSIGNPYASRVDFSTVGGITGVSSTFYVWDPLIYGLRGTGGYQTLSLAGGYKPLIPTSYYNTSTPAPYLESGQAVFVYNPGASPVTMTFTESNKATGSHLAFKAADVSVSEFFRAYLVTASGKIADGNATVFNIKYQDKIDAYDARKISNTGENFGLKRDGIILAIEARAPLTASDTIYFDLKNVATQNYALQFVPENMQNEPLTAYLLDNYLKTATEVSLSGTTNINFTVNSNAASYAADRFKVIFRQASVAAVLPVTFVSIKAVQKDEDVVVNWNVANENNLLQYDVEKSTDGTHFEKVATVAANNNGSANYQWIDKNASSGYNYYRVVSVDKDKKTSYSTVVNVLITNLKPAITIYPNPITDGIIHLQLVNQPQGRYGFRLLNPLGQVLVSKQTEFAGGNGSENIQWNYSLAHGVYQLETTRSDGSVTVIRVLY